MSLQMLPLEIIHKIFSELDDKERIELFKAEPGLYLKRGIRIDLKNFYTQDQITSVYNSTISSWIKFGYISKNHQIASPTDIFRFKLISNCTLDKLKLPDKYSSNGIIKLYPCKIDENHIDDKTLVFQTEEQIKRFLPYAEVFVQAKELRIIKTGDSLSLKSLFEKLSKYANIETLNFVNEFKADELGSLPTVKLINTYQDSLDGITMSKFPNLKAITNPEFFEDTPQEDNLENINSSLHLPLLVGEILTTFGINGFRYNYINTEVENTPKLPNPLDLKMLRKIRRMLDQVEDLELPVVLGRLTDQAEDSEYLQNFIEGLYIGGEPWYGILYMDYFEKLPKKIKLPQYWEDVFKRYKELTEESKDVTITIKLFEKLWNENAFKVPGLYCRLWILLKEYTNTLDSEQFLLYTTANIMVGIMLEIKNERLRTTLRKTIKDFLELNDLSAFFEEGSKYGVIYKEVIKLKEQWEKLIREVDF